MKNLLFCQAFVAVVAALVISTTDAESKRAISLHESFSKIEEFINKPPESAVQSTHPETGAGTLISRFQSILRILEEINSGQERSNKRDNLIDKVEDIQDLLDKFVASQVNGTPMPSELVALGADTDPNDFVMKVILMAAGNLSKRDLLSVAKVI